MKTVWQFFKRMGPDGSIEITSFERVCKRLFKPGADVQGLCYRAQTMSLVAMTIQTQQLAPNEAGTLDMKVFKAMAKIPLEWMGEGVREELPFDVERFLQQCA